MFKAVFIDRDGVINELIYFQDLGIIDTPFTPEQFRLLPGVGEAIRAINEMGYKAIVVSNQPGIARNHFTEETLAQIDAKMNQELARAGAFLDAIYYCPHHPRGDNGKYRMECDCRKPKPGLLLRAAQDLNIDLSASFMVGDNITDIQAGRSAGCHTILVGRMKCELCHMMEEVGVRPDFIVPDLLEAAETIKNGKGGREWRFSLTVPTNWRSPSG